jgi:hypothetical protein
LGLSLWFGCFLARKPWHAPSIPTVRLAANASSRLDGSMACVRAANFRAIGTIRSLTTIRLILIALQEKPARLVSNAARTAGASWVWECTASASANKRPARSHFYLSNAEWAERSADAVSRLQAAPVQAGGRSRLAALAAFLLNVANLTQFLGR